MEQKKSLYTYNGPVRVFNDIAISNWVAQTWATSERKARSNFMFQAKRALRLTPDANVRLTGTISG